MCICWLLLFLHVLLLLKHLASNVIFFHSWQSLTIASLIYSNYVYILFNLILPSFVVFLFPLFLPLQLSQFVSLFSVFHFFNMTIQSQSEGFYNFTMSYPCNMPSCSCLFSFSSVFLLLRVHIFPLLSSYIVFLGARIHSIQKRVRERRVGKDMERTCCGLF